MLIIKLNYSLFYNAIYCQNNLKPVYYKFIFNNYWLNNIVCKYNSTETCLIFTENNKNPINHKINYKVVSLYLLIFGKSDRWHFLCLYQKHKFINLTK